jgi:hypothetical protein
VCGAPRAGVYSPPLIGHATSKGAFLFNDAIAQKTARGVCPAAPTSVAGIQTSKDILCARLWGAPAAAFAHLRQDAKACEIEVHRASESGAGKRECEDNEACTTMYAQSVLAEDIPEIGLTLGADGGVDAGAHDASSDAF